MLPFIKQKLSHDPRISLAMNIIPQRYENKYPHKSEQDSNMKPIHHIKYHKR